MLNIKKIIAQELNLQFWQVENSIKLREEGGTLHFIARYRKENTGNLDEIILRNLFDRYDYLLELEERKKTIIHTITEQGKLTDELKQKIENCLSKNELEDLYLPYKPKKRTRATIAKEKGLEPLAILIKEHNNQNAKDLNLSELATQFVNTEKGVNTIKEALTGASDIIAEEISEIAEYRAWIRNYIMENGYFKSFIKDEFEIGTTKYEIYRDFKVSVKDIQPHTMLALRRGEAEGIIILDIEFDENIVLDYLNNKIILNKNENIKKFYENTIKDSFSRLIKNSIIGEVRLAKKIYADEESIKVFEKNLRQILLTPPAGQKATIGIDPGFRTGCKLAVINETGKFIEYKTIFPFNSDFEKEKAKTELLELIEKYKIELIAIGNGTASRETETFVKESIANLQNKPLVVIVNESGASVYSASKVAQEEFPNLDLTVRGAISIGRRLQDPLAELVKIDPKSIGVGQYQHDVDQKLLKKKLDETVASCVNYVGVDLNTASKELLTYVSGITPRVAENIIEWRNQNGKFTSREDLKKVPFLGDKTYEQAAGFLRIRNAKNILDNTAVHPESYYLVEMFSKDLNLSLEDIVKNPSILKNLDLNKYCDDKVGIPTLTDIIAELEKPGRDPRDEFRWANFHDGIKDISDLKPGMILEGVVTNITNFGAFVDIGVHQDGLVHISEISNQYVKDPTKVLKVGQIVDVKVLEVNEKLKRISLSIKQTIGTKKEKNNKIKKNYSIEDLKNKFSG